ncbi:MAG: LapA family protein [Novosphingobium sp.]
MQIVRTIIWVVITAILVGFIAMNWTDAPVRFWPLSNGDFLKFDWPVGVIALVFFLLGLVPMWLLAKAARWRMNRQISALQTTSRTSMTTNSLSAAQAHAPVPIDPEPIDPAN